MTDIAPEVVERALTHVRTMAAKVEGWHFSAMGSDYQEAHLIAALLPKPIDPDLLEAREMVARGHDKWAGESPWHAGEAERVRSGRDDHCFRVADTLAGIRRGRELTEQERSEWSNSFADRKDEERG